ncbi:MAG TPA: hypothetical protein VHB25_14725 [Gemmatimonadaceae bacterium]|nr:hypothetical protein [Gemmatimonadaceae bacterium]
MAELPNYDSEHWTPETGASTGDARENDPRDAGFTNEQDRVFRSHFQHVNRLADRSYEQVEAAYRLGFEAGRTHPVARRDFEDIEKDLEGGWLNVRVSGGDWAAVREFARVGFDAARQGRIEHTTAAGTTLSHDRPSFSDPVPDNTDPTAPESPEQTLAYQHETSADQEWLPHDLRTDDPYASPQPDDSPTDAEH